MIQLKDLLNPNSGNISQQEIEKVNEIIGADRDGFSHYKHILSDLVV